MSEIQFQKAPYGIAASLVEGENVTFGFGRTHAETEENLREKRAEPSPEPEAAPASEAQAPAVTDKFVFEQEANMIERDLRFYVARLHGHCTALREKLERRGKLLDQYAARQDELREKLAAMSSRAIDAEEHVIPGLRETLKQAAARVAILDAQKVGLPQIPDKPREMAWADYWRDVALRQREQIALDALRAVQAWREKLSKARNLIRSNCECLVCTIYDTLAGKDGE